MSGGSSSSSSSSSSSINCNSSISSISRSSGGGSSCSSIVLCFVMLINTYKFIKYFTCKYLTLICQLYEISSGQCL